METEEAESLEALFQLHAGLARKGPGSTTSTLRALDRVRPYLPERPAVADLGCGSGPASLILAKTLHVPILAIDVYPGFIEELRTRAGESGLGELIDARVGDMAAPPIEAGSLDLIWSEGAVYILGFEAGLARWRAYLRPRGCIAATELSWFREDRPSEAAAFFEDGYPDMRSIDANAARAERAGFEVLETFPLPKDAWWDYYGPLLARCQEFEAGADPSLAATIVETRREAEIFERHGDAYGYAFYLLRRTG